MKWSFFRFGFWDGYVLCDCIFLSNREMGEVALTVTTFSGTISLQSPPGLF